MLHNFIPLFDYLLSVEEFRRQVLPIGVRARMLGWDCGVYQFLLQSVMYVPHELLLAVFHILSHPIPQGRAQLAL